MFKKFAELVAGKAIKSVKPNVPKTNIQKKIRDLKIGNQKLKASGAKLDQTIFEIKNKQPITFKKNKGKTKSNTELKKKKDDDAIAKEFGVRFKKADGGRIGRKFGSPKPKTNVQKIKETFSPKKNLSPKQMKIAKLAGDPKKIDEKDLAKLRKS